MTFQKNEKLIFVIYSNNPHEHKANWSSFTFRSFIELGLAYLWVFAHYIFRLCAVIDCVLSIADKKT